MGQGLLEIITFMTDGQIDISINSMLNRVFFMAIDPVGFHIRLVSLRMTFKSLLNYNILQ